MPVLRFGLDASHVATARAAASAACLGGRSHVRGADRLAALGTDQIVGQLGTLAGHLYWLGTDRHYLRSRREADADPWKGDGGSDVPGANVDFKTSLMRRSRNPLDYRLIVRPAERHRGTVYVLCLLDAVPESDGGGATVFLVGWTVNEQLPAAADPTGRFAGAHVVPARQLHPLPPVRWQRHP